MNLAANFFKTGSRKRYNFTEEFQDFLYAHIHAVQKVALQIAKFQSAEAVRFELTIGFPQFRFSKPVPSTTQPRFLTSFVIVSSYLLMPCAKAHRAFLPAAEPDKI